LSEVEVEKVEVDEELTDDDPLEDVKEVEVVEKVEYENFLEFRNKEKIGLENINGINYLMGIKIDTNGNPDFFPNYQAEKGKDVPVIIDKRIINDMIENTPFTENDFPSDNTNKAFVNLVQAIVDIWENQIDELPNMSYMKFQAQVGIDPKTVRRFLGIGAKVHLVEWEKRLTTKGESKGTFLQKIPSKRKEKKVSDQEYIENFTVWMDNPFVQKWFLDDANTSARIGFKAKKVPNPKFDPKKPESPENLKMIYEGGRGVAGELFKIMTVMKISPERLAGYRQYDNGLELLKERLAKKVWEDPRTLKTDPASKGKYEGVRWNILDWAKAKYAPDPFYKIKKGKYVGRTRQIESKKTAHNTWYNFAGIIIRYVGTHGLNVPDQDPSSIFAQLANKPKYATIALSADQIIEMQNCIETGQKGYLKSIHNISTVVLNWETGAKKVVTDEKEFALDNSYWNDAHFYFLMSLEMGYRAEEAFTIIAQETEEESDDSGLIFYDHKQMQVPFAQYEKGNPIQVQIYTRKSERPNVAGQGTKIHAGFIESPACKELIVARYTEVLAGMQSKDPSKYGIRKELDGEVYTEHALIGTDGRYTKEGTLNFPSDKYQSEEDQRLEGTTGTVVGTDNRDKMRAMMKHCYHAVGLTKAYWYERSLHALRHVFAQYWCILSDYNYGFVALLGHWKTETIVKEVYGKQKGFTVNRLQKKFSTGEHGDRTPFEIMREKEKQMSNVSEIEAKRSQMQHPDMDAERLADQQARDSIYNNGGMYGGKMYEKGANPKSIVKVRDADPKTVDGSA
jgi:hypothetical protein